MSWDKSWEKLYKKRGWGEYPNEELIKFIARNFYQYPNRKKIKILELGCGIGSNLWYLAKEKFKVYGIDGSKTAISKSIKKLDKEVPNWKGQVTTGDIINIQYPDNFFDAVVDLESITHNSFENSIKIYEESFRVLKNNGKLFSRTFCVGTWGDNTGKKLGINSWKVSEGPMKGHCNFIRFTKKNQIKILLKKFDIVNIDKISLSVNNEKNKIIEWLIYAKK
tara:strand:- start:43 stop:708 length:666 start_codon:yes stop_codon:yes gene_type:complete